jgi:hypothetical protein
LAERQVLRRGPGVPLRRDRARHTGSLRAWPWLRRPATRVGGPRWDSERLTLCESRAGRPAPISGLGHDLGAS